MRATALIRKWLELELMQEQIAKQLREVKEEFQQNHLDILEEIRDSTDIRIQYRWNKRLYEGVFMRKMLDAQIQGVWKHWKEPVS
jgi:hypothetical protein